MLEDYPDILNSKDVMEILDISKELLYDLIHTGQLPAFRVSKKRWRFNKTALIQHFYSMEKENYSQT